MGLASVPDTHTAGRILSRSPLVTISNVNRDVPAGIASFAPDLFDGKPALHLLHHTWTLQRGDARWITEAIQRAQSLLPQSSFVMLASNDLEALEFSARGEQCFVASALMFLDERVWRPIAGPNAQPQFGAVYVSRPDRMKRHELAARIERLLLIYGYALDKEGDSLARVRALLPNAYFANHEVGEGRYRYLGPETVAMLLGRSQVGLCLSAEEGCMRASMEYLMCGLPIVSTRSLGGRDRYFVGDYCKIVDDDPEAVAWAVTMLKNRNLDRMRIREHVGQLVAFDRYNFLLTINGLVESRFGVSDVFPSIMPFIGAGASFEKASVIYERIKTTLTDMS